MQATLWSSSDRVYPSSTEQQKEDQVSHRKAAAPHITTQTDSEETERVARETGTETTQERRGGNGGREAKEEAGGESERQVAGREFEDGRWRRKRSQRREDRGRKWSKRAENAEGETRGESR